MTKKLTYADIAYKILRQNNEVRSLHYKSIAHKAFQQNLLDSDDLIVAGNVSSSINAEIRKAKMNDEESRFISYGKGKYGLTENEPTGIFKDIKEKNNAVKKALLASVMEMPPYGFENLVGEVLRHLGFENIEVTQKSGDGGIDVKGELVVAGSIKSNICVQVKRWKNNKVPRDEIAKLRGSLMPHQTGLFITTSEFSKKAVEEANDPFKTPISLINGKEFVDIMCSYGIGVTSEEVVVYDIDKDGGFSDIPSNPPNDNKEIEIFANYKGKKYFALYYSPTKVVYENVVYPSPSSAGVEVQGGKQVNGWRFWKFVDKTDGKTYPIDRLRQKG